MMKPHLRLIHLIGVIVPRRVRADWRQEWQAELQYREAMLAEWDRLDWRARFDLTARSIGAFWDALWMQSYRWEDDMIQDIRFGLRMLLKNPGFTFVAVLTLALGIGANTAIFSVVNAVLLRPLPYRNTDELVMFYFASARTAPGSEAWFTSPAAHLNLKSQNSVFADVAAWGNDLWSANLTGYGESERLQGFKVSANFFHTLGVKAFRGRTFLEEEDQPGNSHVVVISYDFWQRRFGGDPQIIGNSIQLNGEPYNVIGVMPDSFRFVLKTDVWTTLAFTPTDLSENKFYLHQVFRLKPNVSIEQARSEVENLLLPYATFTDSDLRGSGHLKPLQTILFSSESEMLFVLLAAAGFVLAVVCVNIANLLLARSSVRRRELAIRAALGARRLRVARQLLVESSMLALAGSLCGLLIAGWFIPFLVGGLPESVVAKNWHVASLKIDSWALGYTLALSVLTTLIFGLIPALQSSRVSINEALKEGGRSDAPSRGHNRFRSLLVVTEVALAMILLVGAGLMIKSFWRLNNADRGFDTTGVLMAKIDLSGDHYHEFDQVVEFYRQLLERISAIPGVEHSGIVNSSEAGWRVAIEEKPSLPKEQRPVASRQHVSADFFRAMGIQIRAGRFFTDRDVKGAPPVAIINESLARRFFPDENPIGKHLRFEDTLREIVGVVGATRAWRPYSFNSDELFPRVYIPYQQENWWSMTVIIRAQSGDPMSLIPSIRRELAAIDKDQPIYSFKLLDQSVSELNSDRRFSTLLLAAFAALATLLAAIGIYGVMSYSVNQRTREIGIRMALGAQSRDVLKLIMRQGLMLLLAGCVIGLAGAFALTRLMESMLFEVSATDPLTYASITLLLAAVSMLGCWIPARQATKVDPLVALKHE